MLIESVRRDMDTVEISLTSEEHLLRVLGHSMHYIHGKKSQKTWKKLIKRIVKTIRKVIELNVNSDNFHKLRLEYHLESVEEACRSKFNVDPQIILSLTEIIFELLGNEPDYSRRSRLTRKSDFLLNKLRTLHYTQTPNQKVDTIIEASRYEPFCKDHKSDELFQEYVTNFKCNPDGFIEWYKSEFPNNYIKLF